MRQSSRLRRLLACLLVLVTAIGGCSRVPFGSATNTGDRAQPAAQPTPPSDFALIFDTNPCGAGRLDTFQGTFTQGKLWKQPRTVKLTLSANERQRIYAKMLDIDFFRYPTEYSVVTPDKARGMVAPASTYYLKIRSDGRIKELRWTDNITDPSTDQAERLREFMGLLEDITAAQAEVRRLPTADAGCL